MLNLPILTPPHSNGSNGVNIAGSRRGSRDRSNTFIVDNKGDMNSSLKRSPVRQRPPPTLGAPVVKGIGGGFEMDKGMFSRSHNLNESISGKVPPSPSKSGSGVFRSSPTKQRPGRRQFPQMNGASPFATTVNQSPNGSALNLKPQPLDVRPRDFIPKSLETTKPIKFSSGAAETQGRRPTMEDAHSSHILIKNHAGGERRHVSVFGVYDGHCGRHIADQANKQLHTMIVNHPLIGEDTPQAIVESFIQMDRKMYTVNKGRDGGSTAITAVVVDRDLYVGCLGDARAVLAESVGPSSSPTTSSVLPPAGTIKASSGRVQALPMSRDHKPSLGDEKARIEAAGGFVDWDRVGGCLAVSRAFGDFEFKQGLMTEGIPLIVSNIPEITHIPLTDSAKFLILACDGLWDVVSSEEAVAHAYRAITVSSAAPGGRSASTGIGPNLDKVAESLVRLAMDKMTTDNVSAMVITFHAP